MTESELLTVHEVAQIFRVDDTTVRRWVKQGVLEAIVLPHARKRVAYRFRREVVASWMENPAKSTL